MMANIENLSPRTGRVIREDGTVINEANEYFGKSTDTKPTANVQIGSTFFEIDTTTVYMFDGSNWVVI